MLWNEAVGLATRQEQNHGRFDSHRYTAAPTHDRRHAHAQAGAQDSGSLHPRRLQAGRLPETLARHRQRGRSAALPAALGRSGELPITLNATLTGLKFFFDITLDRGELVAKMQPVRVP